MSKIKQLSDLLRGFQSGSISFVTGTVVSIENTTCTVNIGSLTITDVRLLPTTMGSENHVLLMPKPGSDVLLGSMSGDYSNLFVISCDTVDKMEITCNGQNLMLLLSQWLQALAKAQVITPAGNGTFDPATIAALIQIENSLKMIFV